MLGCGTWLLTGPILRGTWKGEGGGVLVSTRRPTSWTCFCGTWAEIREVFGIGIPSTTPISRWTIPPFAVVRFKAARWATSWSAIPNPALYGNVHVHGENGASVGVKTDGGAMFIAGVSGIAEPPVNDLWTVAGEADRLARWNEEDAAFFHSIDGTDYFHRAQLKDFLGAIDEGRAPRITLEDGLRTVELFTAIYRSTRDHAIVRFPLEI
jgi:hypothetical protein